MARENLSGKQEEKDKALVSFEIHQK